MDHLENETVSATADLGGKGVSEDDLLRVVPQRHPLRGLGAAGVFRDRHARRFQNTEKLGDSE